MLQDFLKKTKRGILSMASSILNSWEASSSSRNALDVMSGPAPSFFPDVAAKALSLFLVA